MVTFIGNAKDIAEAEIYRLNPALTERFLLLIDFLISNPDTVAGKDTATLQLGSAEYIKKIAAKFVTARKIRPPKSPETSQDKMVGVILERYFNVPTASVENAVKWHRDAMGAENIIGDLLERYIAEVLEPHGWVWCSGAIVKAADFVHRKPDGTWNLLQVKNRDNSESSSSAAIRNGTQIKHWFRTFSARAGENWGAFPLSGAGVSLSEDGFRAYVINYLDDLS